LELSRIEITVLVYLEPIAKSVIWKNGMSGKWLFDKAGIY
jgi:hypothetical protein